MGKSTFKWLTDSLHPFSESLLLNSNGSKILSGHTHALINQVIPMFLKKIQTHVIVWICLYVNNLYLEV